MADRELLELALIADGRGIHHKWQASRDACGVGKGLWLTDGTTTWNPLENDGQALRLAVKTGIQVLYADFTGEAEAKWNRGADRLTEYGPDDPRAATRRAITRAAAEIGKAMHPTKSGKDGVA